MTSLQRLYSHTPFIPTIHDQGAPTPLRYAGRESDLPHHLADNGLPRSICELGNRLMLMAFGPLGWPCLPSFDALPIWRFGDCKQKTNVLTLMIGRAGAAI